MPRVSAGFPISVQSDIDTIKSDITTAINKSNIKSIQTGYFDINNAYTGTGEAVRYEYIDISEVDISKSILVLDATNSNEATIRFNTSTQIIVCSPTTVFPRGRWRLIEFY